MLTKLLLKLAVCPQVADDYFLIAVSFHATCFLFQLANEIDFVELPPTINIETTPINIFSDLCILYAIA